MPDGESHIACWQVFIWLQKVLRCPPPSARVDAMVQADMTASL